MSKVTIFESEHVQMIHISTLFANQPNTPPFSMHFYRAFSPSYYVSHLAHATPMSLVYKFVNVPLMQNIDSFVVAYNYIAQLVRIQYVE